MNAVLFAFVALFAQASKILYQHETLDVVPDTWCEFNVFPSPNSKFDAKGLQKHGNVIRGQNLTDLQGALTAAQSWSLNRMWQFKAKVTSGYDIPLTFGFSGGNGFFEFDVAASASDQIIDLTEKVKCNPGDAALEYRGNDPAVLSMHSVVFSELCLRQVPCANFEECVPSYHYKAKTDKSGDTFDQCCEPVYCKDTVSCTPDTQWKEYPDFDNRMGNTKENCCIPKSCPQDICNGTKYSPKSGVGMLGSTTEECCNPRYCADYTKCSASNDEAKLPDANQDGTPRLGSTDEECCNVVPCSEFNCTSDHGLWGPPAEPKGHGHDFAHCCDPLFCANFSCDSTKYHSKANAPVQGNTNDRCCEPIFCSNHTCSDTMVLMARPNERYGSTDEECCETKLCKDYECSDKSKYVKKPLVIEDQTAGTEIARVGFTDEECCSPVYCKDFSCTSTKWKAKETLDPDTLGSTFDTCCEKVFCENYTCTSDYDGDGNGTMWYKRIDTNAFKWQGNSDEECCYPKYCSQYTTEFPTKWKRKEVAPGAPALIGSTDHECYDAQMCEKFCGCDKEGKILRHDANNTLGSTVDECCESVQPTTTTAR